MNATDFVALLPLLILGATPVVIMLMIAARRNHALAMWTSVVGLAATFISLWPAGAVGPRQVTPLLIIDRFALFFIGLMSLATIAVVLLAYGYFEKLEINREELYVLLLTALLGSAVLVTSNHFVSFFLGLEILSVSLYALAAYTRTRGISLEAGLKYLILAAASAAFLLFGMALIYSELGTMQFIQIAALQRSGFHRSDSLLVGLVFIVTGIGFKLALVPFHMWTADVYEGAPAPVTAFIASVSKGAMFALLLRYFYQTGSQGFPSIFLVLAIIAIASMFVGNLLALLQNNVKRILAYSSIAHLGYLMVAFLAGGSRAAEAVSFYLVAYFVTTIGAFGVLTVMSDGRRDSDSLEDYRGLFWRKPLLAGIFTLMLLSLAGIPLTAGFVAKFFIVAAGASASIWGLLIVLIVTSTIGLYYYLRVVVALYSTAGAEPAPSLASISVSGSYVLVALALLLVWLGTFPSFVLSIIRQAAASLI